MRGNMTDSSAWYALSGALGGILLTGGFTLATTVLNHRWSEKASERSHRDQKTREAAERLRGVFHDYLVATNAYYHAVHQMHEHRNFVPAVRHILPEPICKSINK